MEVAMGTTWARSSSGGGGNQSGVIVGEACPPPYDRLRVPLLLLYISVLLVGLPANALTAWLTGRQARRGNVLAVYLCALSACDLVYLLTLPLWALYIARGHHWQWGLTACKATGFVFFTNMYVSVLLLCCISCDRYVAVGYALESRGLRGRRAAVALAAAVTAGVMVAHVPVFLMREKAGGEHVGSHGQRCFEPDHSHSSTLTAFNYARFALGFALPLALLSAANHGVLRAVRASTSLRPRQKRRVRALAVAVVTMFLVCFAPYHLVLLARTVSFHFLPHGKGEEEGGVACRFSQWIYVPYILSLGLSTLNSACNPILYVLCSEDVRKELYVMLGCCGGGGATGTTAAVTACAAGTAVGVNAPAGPEDYRRLKSEVDSSGSTGEECLMTPQGGNAPVGFPVNLLEEQEDAP